MKRFGDMFMYETAWFEAGKYRNCRLLKDIIASDGHVYAYAHEVFPLVEFNSTLYEFSFFEDFDLVYPLFTITYSSKF